jgi:hypothetical protein
VRSSREKDDSDLSRIYGLLWERGFIFYGPPWGRRILVPVTHFLGALEE